MTMSRITATTFAAFVAVAASASVAPTAEAIPDPGANPSSDAHPAITPFIEEPGQRPCFLVRAHWNTSLDAAQPTCSRSPYAAS